MTLPIDPSARKRYRSGAVIAKILSTEGFTEDLANKLDIYWRHAAGLTERQRKQFADLEEEFGTIMSTLGVGDRLVVGKFIGYLKKVGFDTGLKIGLGAFVARNCQDVDSGLPTPDPSRRGRREAEVVG